MNRTHLFNSAKSALVATLTIALIGLASYITLEPVASRAAVEIFTVSQGITAELSFLASTTDVTMTPTIAGLTGGTANGQAIAVVTTNSAGGYNMTLEFSSSTAMYGEVQNGEIKNYTPANANLPDYTFAIGGTGTQGEFAYSVSASTTSDLDQTFLDDGATNCGTGSTDTGGVATCWYAASSTVALGLGAPIAEKIIDRATPTGAGGATTTVHFRVSVPSSPSPAITVDTYTATATLTAIAQ